MEFTPQQLGGSGAYGFKVMIGNWSEDMALSNARAAEYHDQMESKTRVMDRIDRVLELEKKPIQLSYTEEGVVHYGHTLAIKHATGSKYLAVNLHEELNEDKIGTNREFQISATSKSPSLRSSFVVLSADDSNSKGVLNYGDEIVLATNPELLVNPHSGLCQFPLYLASFHKSVNGVVGMSNEQEACVLRFYDKDNQAIRWRVERTGGSSQPPNGDNSVRLDTNVQLVHCATGRSLSMDDAFTLLNLYGKEHEVFCALDHKKSKVHKLKAEMKGIATGDNRIPVQVKNWWVFEGAARPSSNSKKELEFINPETVRTLLMKELDKLGGIEWFENVLRDEDQAGDNTLHRASVEMLLDANRILLSEDEVCCLLNEISDPITHGVLIPDFIGWLRAARA